MPAREISRQSVGTRVIAFELSGNGSMTYAVTRVPTDKCRTEKRIENKRG